MILKQSLAGLAALATLGLSACTERDQASVAGGLVGATAGAVTAQLFDADDNWTVVSALAGAAAGSLIARNEVQDTCAYADGQGGYYTAPCP